MRVTPGASQADAATTGPCVPSRIVEYVIVLPSPNC
jgi:hypothetical protein